MMDQHTHTNYSPDASESTTFLDYIKQAKKLGFQGMMVTEHMDYDSPDPLFHQLIPYDEYFQAVQQLKIETQFDIRVGVEIGYQKQSLEKIHTLIAKYPFDFVILSIHIIDGLDPYDGSYFQGKTKTESIQRYFEVLLEAVQSTDDFDVVGHFDYIMRYGNFEDRSIAISDYQELIDAILTTLISKGKGIEINTSGMDDLTKSMYPSLTILKRYHQLGGRMITLGSDAHHERQLGRYFPEAIALLKEAGFEEMALYQNRIPTMIPLEG